MRRAFVIGNAVWDETFAMAALPVGGASVHADFAAAGPGGKGLNQAVALSRAGAAVAFLTALGGDAQSRRIAAAVEAEGIDLTAESRSDVATDRSIILVDKSGQNVVVTTRDAAAGIGRRDVREWLGGAAEGDLCVLQGNLSFEATRAAIEAAARHGLMLAFNPSPVDPRHVTLLDKVDALFVNEDEARALTDGAEGADAARALCRAGAAAVVLTLGGHGALLSAEGETVALAAPIVRALDPTAAGDVLMATALAHAAPRGWRLNAAAVEAGIRAAALAVTRSGAFAALPMREELSAILEAH